MSRYDLISYNKDYINRRDFKIGLDNRAFRYGDGFFETIHANGTEMQFVESHYKRMLKASEILHINLPDYFTLSFFQSQVKGLLVRNKLFQAVRVKVTIYRTGGGLFITGSSECDIIIESQYLGKGRYELNERGLHIGIYEDMPKPITFYSSVKSLNSMFYIMAGVFAKNNNFDDVLLLNTDGVIVEATSSNIFAVLGSKIYTPPLSSGCVEGVMRQQIIKIAESSGFTVAQKNIRKEELPDFDEIFLTNAISGIRYVSSFGKKRYYKKVSQNLIYALNDVAFN